MRLIVSGTGTGVGKTVVACGLAQALASRGVTKGIKPYETGVDGAPLDAAALEQAAGTPCQGTYFRATDPVAPGALLGPPSIDEMAAQISRELESCEHAVIEGAGGLFVPLTKDEVFADLAARLSLPILLVTYDGLGTLSHTLATLEAAKARGLDIAATILNQGAGTVDVSRTSNERVLREHSDVPILMLGASLDRETLSESAQEILTFLFAVYHD